MRGKGFGLRLALIGAAMLGLCAAQAAQPPARPS